MEGHIHTFLTSVLCRAKIDIQEAVNLIIIEVSWSVKPCSLLSTDYYQFLPIYQTVRYHLSVFSNLNIHFDGVCAVHHIAICV